MLSCPWQFLHDEQKHIISLIGGGGKTTIMYELANFYAAAGKKAVVLTTTHIWLPNGKDVQGGAYGADWPAVASLWQQGRFAVIGTLEQGTGKLIAPGADLLRQALECCDVAIIEADGAKQMPCKLPAENEPVLLPASDIVIAVAGLDALGRSLEGACFRWQLGRTLFDRSCNLLMDEAKLAQLLLSEQGGRKAVGTRDFYVALNKCDRVAAPVAEQLRELLVVRGMEVEKIWLRGLLP